MTIEEVRQIVIAEFKVTETELRGKSRKGKLVSARKVYTYLCHKYLHHTYQQIGAGIRKSHFSVIHNLRTVRNWMSYNDPLIGVIKKIENQFFNS